MPDDGSSARTYTEKEISRILKRASAMQEQAAPESSGLSLEEIQQVAADAGIDPRFIVAAASELERQTDTERPFHLFGGPMSILEERTVAGRLTEEQREAVLADVRRVYRRAGTVNRIGRTLEWTHSDRNDQVQVSFTERGDRTEIRVFERFQKVAVLMYVLPLSIMLQFAINIPIFLELSMGLGALVGLSIMGATFLAARFAYSRAVRGKERKARQLLDRLEKTITDPAPSTPTSSATGAATRLHGTLENDIAPVSESPERPRQRTTS